MYERQFRGELQAVAWRDGSSGRFFGDLDGLYDGFRSGNPPEQAATVELAHGRLAFVLRQQQHVPLPPRPARHPFADGPSFEELVARAAELAGAWHLRPGGAGAQPFKGEYRTTITLTLDPDRCTGIWAGATGEMAVEAPAHKEAGYLVVRTGRGDLRLEFLEWAEQRRLRAELRVDGEQSTGLYHGATGELEFVLDLTPPNLGRGPYSGVLRWQRRPA